MELTGGFIVGVVLGLGVLAAFVIGLVLGNTK